ncbi:MAG: TonB-dependent receptor [Planctomycetes bacterium]|nr:TonB-dependent receptor [Planctomycetota bacterium]
MDTKRERAQRASAAGLGWFLVAACLGLARGQDAAGGADSSRPTPGDLDALSLEELLDVEVTSVAKKEQRLSESAAAVYVITQEDIRRSGIREIPELLRLVPGLQVARIDSNKWAISSRGFNGRFANKLLVLIDGRSVYTPLFSGVYWDVQDTLVKDIERIEVIRGPGAALWGANAVNGVINIITKAAEDTQGGLVTGGGGSEDPFSGGLRYGGAIGERAHYRVYGKYANHDDFVYAGGGDAADEWDLLQGGFRLDWKAAPSDLLTIQGDTYAGEVQSRTTIAVVGPPFSQTRDDAAHLFGANALARWTHTFSESSEGVLQAYYDRADRNDHIFPNVHDTFDVDLQHRFAALPWNEVTWGLGYRAVLDQLEDGPSAFAAPQSRTVHLLNGFLQDESRFFGDALRITLGTKLEHNDFTGLEVQPSGRIAWIASERHTFWGAASHAVRTPSRAENDIRFNSSASPGLVAAVFGTNGTESEALHAFELGYRTRPLDWISLDAAAFYNLYDGLQTTSAGIPFFEASPPPAHVVVPLAFGNKMEGETLGVELSVAVRATEWWKLSGGYTFLEMSLDARSSAAAGADDAEDRSPANQAHLRSYFDLPWDLELDLLLFYVDHISGFRVPSYVRLDARLGWRPTKDLEVSVGVQNALDDRHPEFGAEPLTTPSEVEHSVYGRLTWRF